VVLLLLLKVLQRVLDVRVQGLVEVNDLVFRLGLQPDPVVVEVLLGILQVPVQVLDVAVFAEVGDKVVDGMALRRLRLPREKRLSVKLNELELGVFMRENPLVVLILDWSPGMLLR